MLLTMSLNRVTNVTRSLDLKFYPNSVWIASR